MDEVGISKGAGITYLQGVLLLTFTGSSGDITANVACGKEWEVARSASFCWGTSWWRFYLEPGVLSFFYQSARSRALVFWGSSNSTRTQCILQTTTVVLSVTCNVRKPPHVTPLPQVKTKTGVRKKTHSLLQRDKVYYDPLPSSNPFLP